MARTLKTATMSAKRVKISTNVRALTITPFLETKKTIDGLETISMTFEREEFLKAVASGLALITDRNTVTLTAFRKQGRGKDGTYKVTVTSKKPNASKRI